MTDIAVLMAAYNSEATLQEAVNSVLASTIPVDLFIVDDGSRTPVSETIAPDARVTIIRLEQNGGLANALNTGLETILTKDYAYIARMDTDDIAHPERFEKQRAFMEAYPDIALAGCRARFFDENTGETKMYYNPPTSPEHVRDALFFNSAVLHPSWFMRAQVLKNTGIRYTATYRAAEDYEFLCRLAQTHKLANLPEYLLDYRVSSGGISLKKRRRQLADRLAIQMSIFEAPNWRSWAGIIKTLLLFAAPVGVLAAIKRRLFCKKN